MATILAGPVRTEVAQLPAAPLSWRVEQFPTAAAAHAAATATSLVLEAEGQSWLFTLGGQGERSPAGAFIAEIGPLTVPAAASYLLQVAETAIPAGTGAGAVHSHPGTESFYVVAGEQTIRTVHGERHTGAGQSEIGAPAGTPVQFVATGPEERRAFGLFVLDASQPFESPARFASTATT